MMRLCTIVLTLERQNEAHQFKFIFPFNVPFNTKTCTESDQPWNQYCSYSGCVYTVFSSYTYHATFFLQENTSFRSNFSNQLWNHCTPCPFSVTFKSLNIILRARKVARIIQIIECFF